jgi:hypothetical protein
VIRVVNWILGVMTVVSSKTKVLIKTRPSLRSIQGITSVPCACHGAFEVNGLGIDLQLPAKALPLSECATRPSLLLPLV